MDNSKVWLHVILKLVLDHESLLNFQLDVNTINNEIFVHEGRLLLPPHLRLVGTFLRVFVALVTRRS